MTHRIRATIRPCAQRSRWSPLALALVLLGSLLPAAAAANPAASSSGDTRVVVRNRDRVRVVSPDGSHRPLLVRGKRGFLGVDLLELTPELRRHFGAGDDAGVLVAHVEAGSPAALAGLRVGDVLLSIDGEAVKSSWSLRDVIAPRQAGEVVSLEVIRDGSRQKLQATLAEREGRVVELGRLMEGRLLRDGDGDATVFVLPSSKDWEKLGKEWAKVGEEWGRWGEQLGAEIAESFADPQVWERIERQVEERERLQRKIELLERRLRELEKRLDEQKR
jgi:membrane-associated protease RseP (regulator of RpoE activity)